jgi:23S rRNA (cytosine1962-C5)-methyltransferase
MSIDAKYGPFFNRLTKNLRHTGRWARKQGITCFRVYDKDMPEFPLAVDLYENIVHVAEYARNHGMDDDEHAAWLTGCVQAISEALSISVSLIYLKFRQRQSGLRQYERFSRVGSEYIVKENGLKFIINPSDYLDTGLFLDHRNTRQWVREMAQDKHVLNLFSYTGAFTVYAAAGGAASTTTVDMSNTYLQWADRNLELNGHSGDKHQLLQADVLQWLREPPSRRYDLIVIDPPTFSNSKRMFGTLDVQRDHTWILNTLASRHATPGATIWFSTNYRKFKIESEALRVQSCEDLTDKSIPQDFRNQRIHKCYKLTVENFNKTT